MLIESKELTRGERLLIRRRRDGVTQAEAADEHGISLYGYRQWETDVEGTSPPRVALGKLADHEKCFLMRRRKGWTIVEVAEKVDVCRWWVRQMESGEAPVDRLLDFWAA